MDTWTESKVEESLWNWWEILFALAVIITLSYWAPALAAILVPLFVAFVLLDVFREWMEWDWGDLFTIVIIVGLVCWGLVAMVESEYTKYFTKPAQTTNSHLPNR